MQRRALVKRPGSPDATDTASAKDSKNFRGVGGGRFFHSRVTKRGQKAAPL
jgi:hypothetical protein